MSTGDLMARIDDYLNAKTIAIERLAQEDFHTLCEKSGFKPAGGGSFHIPFLDRRYLVSFPEFEFTDAVSAEREIPIQEQVLILHYLMAENPATPSGKKIAYREIPGAAFYFSAFAKRALTPLKKVFGDNPETFVRAAEKLNGTRMNEGDASYTFDVFPKVPLQIVLWQGDDEFPAEANILFDQNAETVMSPEDAAWLASLLVYRLMALAR